MENGKYKANADSCILGKYSRVNILKGQSIVVDYSELDDTAFIECAPFCTVEVPRNSIFSNFELIE